MDKRKTRNVKLSQQTYDVLSDMKKASGASSLDEEIQNSWVRTILNGRVANKLAEFFLMSAAVIEAEKIAASVQMEIHQRLDQRQLKANVVRLVEELRNEIIEADKRAQYAGADPNFSEPADPIDLASVRAAMKTEEPEAKETA